MEHVAGLAPRYNGRRASHVGPVFARPCPLLMARILCLGMSALDAIYRVPAIPATPTKVLATGYTECGGGMAANASVAVARLGGQAHYWGRVGSDELGDRILRNTIASVERMTITEREKEMIYNGNARKLLNL